MLKNVKDVFLFEIPAFTKVKLCFLLLPFKQIVFFFRTHQERQILYASGSDVLKNVATCEKLRINFLTFCFSEILLKG